MNDKEKAIEKFVLENPDVVTTDDIFYGGYDSREPEIAELKKELDGCHAVNDVANMEIAELKEKLAKYEQPVQAPSVPDERTEDDFYGVDGCLNWMSARGKADGWNACRAAMLAKQARQESLEDLISKHRISVTPEYEGGWRARIYGDSPGHYSSAYAATPMAAVEAVLANV